MCDEEYPYDYSDPEEYITSESQRTIEEIKYAFSIDKIELYKCKDHPQTCVSYINSENNNHSSCYVMRINEKTIESIKKAKKEGRELLLDYEILHPEKYYVFKNNSNQDRKNRLVYVTEKHVPNPYVDPETYSAPLTENIKKFNIEPHHEKIMSMNNFINNIVGCPLVFKKDPFSEGYVVAWVDKSVSGEKLRIRMKYETEQHLIFEKRNDILRNILVMNNGMSRNKFYRFYTVKLSESSRDIKYHVNALSEINSEDANNQIGILIEERKVKLKAINDINVILKKKAEAIKRYEALSPFDKMFREQQI